MCEQMSNVMKNETKGVGSEAASLKVYLTGVTLTADWLIPCPLSIPMMLRGRIAPKVIHANTWGSMQCVTQLHTHMHRRVKQSLILGKAWGIVTFPFKVLQTCYSSKSQVIHFLRRAR